MTEPAGQNPKPAPKCIWYVLATVAGELQSLEDLGELTRDNAYFWNGLMAQRVSTRGDWAESKLGHDLGLKKLSEEDETRIREALDTRGYKGENVPHINDPIDFSNVYFPSLTSFNDFVFVGDVRFDNAKFLGLVSFTDTIFAGSVSFGGVTFGQVLFMKTEFAGNASFQDVGFLKHAYFSHTKFLGKVGFSNATFSDNVLFNSVQFAHEASFVNTVFLCTANFQAAEFRGPMRFQNARFETRVPSFFEATFHEYTDWSDSKWPSVPDDANEAREQVQYYQRLVLMMNKLEKPDDRHLFFRQEMRARRRAEGPSIASGMNWLYKFVCDYGHGLPRISALWFGHLVTGAILLSAIRVVGLPENELTWQMAYKFMHDLPQAFVISFSNAHPFFGLNNGFLQDTIKDWEGVSFFNLIGASQTVMGTVLLFFLLFTIRNRFRMR